MRFFLPAAEVPFRNLCALEKFQSEALLKIVSTKTEFENSEVEKLAAAIKLSFDATSELLRYILAIRSANQRDLKSATITIALKQGATEINLPKRDMQNAAKFLEKLLATDAARQILAKKHRVRRGLGNDFSGVTSLVETRPIYNSDHTKIVDSVAALRLRVDYVTPEGNDESLVVEVDDTGLKRLKDEIRKIDKKRKLLDAKLEGLQ